MLLLEAMLSARTFDDLWIWERVGDRLPWYREVASNRMPAKHLIAGRVPVEVSLGDLGEEALWKAHDEALGRFLETWHAIRTGQTLLRDLPTAAPSLADLSAELGLRMLRHCNFCRWDCGVDRSAGVRHGTCQLEGETRVSSYFHHRGEELVFRGTQGSGTIFFTSCNLRCGFCQNGDISTDKLNGIPFTPERLATAAWRLRREGCHNVNWVGGEPTIHLHTILQAIALLARGEVDPSDLPTVSGAKVDPGRRRTHEEQGLYEGELNVPMLWNSNFFMSPETMRLLRPLIDVWLPDFKFGGDGCAVLLARTPWYWETVTRNHRLVYEWGEDLLIRHLVMPGHVACCTKPVLEWIAAHAPEAPVNVMDQYHQDCACDPASPAYEPKYASMARRPHAEEIREAYAHAQALGLRFEDVTFERAARGAVAPFRPLPG